jgi:hypothetical protein
MKRARLSGHSRREPMVVRAVIRARARVRHRHFRMAQQLNALNSTAVLSIDNDSLWSIACCPKS